MLEYNIVPGTSYLRLYLIYTSILKERTKEAAIAHRTVAHKATAVTLLYALYTYSSIAQSRIIVPPPTTLYEYMTASSVHGTRLREGPTPTQASTPPPRCCCRRRALRANKSGRAGLPYIHDEASNFSLKATSIKELKALEYLRKE